MSKPEVISILGSEPHHLPGKGPVSGLGGTMGSMMMLERSYSWESSECRIYLAFDDDSKVSGKMLVNVYSESLLDKFRTWLCLR
jgi:hypothetical protein